MGWKLLLMLAVLWICYSNGEGVTKIKCSDDSDCEVCKTCSTTSPRFCLPTTCPKPGYLCNVNSGKCEKVCALDSDCLSEPKCNSDSSISATCGFTNFCQSCPTGFQCVREGHDNVCSCDGTLCQEKCGFMIGCCSLDGSSCNCCTKGQQICYEAGDRQKTCLNLCTEDSSPCASDDCESCQDDPNDSNDPKRKVCMPCSAFKKCDEDQGVEVKTCCTGSGPDKCVCCKAGQICKDKRCQCDENECATALCGACESDTGLCIVPDNCD